MSAAMATEAEILKLARLLDIEIDTIDYLGEVPAADLRVLRNHVTDLLFDSGGAIMDRLGQAAKRLPAPLIATICERSFGPLLAARAAARTDPDKAIEIAQRLSPDFLTEVTIHLDPRRVGPIVSGMPEKVVARAADELGRRGEYVTMGRFLSYLSDDALAAALTQLDDEAVLRTAFVLEDPEAVDAAIGTLHPDRIRGILTCATGDGLWPETLVLLGELSEVTLLAVAEVMATMPVSDLTALLDAVAQADQWDDLARFVASMSEQSRAALVTTLAHNAPARQRKVVAAAAERLGLTAEYAAAVGANS